MYIIPQIAKSNTPPFTGKTQMHHPQRYTRTYIATQSDRNTIISWSKTYLEDIPYIKIYSMESSYTIIKQSQDAIGTATLSIPSYAANLGQLPLATKPTEFKAANSNIRYIIPPA